MMRLTQRGDTLVEVVIGLAILASVMAGGFVAANRAYQAGVSARERTALVSEAQQQMEALKSFRDSHTWNEFRYGSNGTADNGTGCNATGQYCGVDDRFGQTDNCNPDAPERNYCFYMKQKDIRQPDGTTLNEWVPFVVDGNAFNYVSKFVPTSKMSITASNDRATASQPVQSYKFRVTYEAEALGGGNKNVGYLFSVLTNISRLEGIRL